MGSEVSPGHGLSQTQELRLQQPVSAVRALSGWVSPDTKSFPKVQGIGAAHLLIRKASLGLSWLEPSHQSWMWQHGWVWRCCCTCPHQ